MTRILVAPIVLAGLTACGGGGSTTAPITTAPACAGPLAGEPVRSKPGARACTEPCLTAQEAACTEGEVWKVRFADHFEANFGTMRVSSTGLTRLEQPGRDLFSVDGELWLSCIPRCGEVANVCFPFPFDVTMRIIDGMDDCKLTTAPGEPWHGYASVDARFECNLGTLVVRAVPELVAVRDAMQSGGLLDGDDPGLELDALPVSLTFQDRTFDIIEEVAVEQCDALAVPTSHQRHATLADFEAVSTYFEEIVTELSSSFATRDTADTLRQLEAHLCARYAGATE